MNTKMCINIEAEDIKEIIQHLFNTGEVGMAQKLNAGLNEQVSREVTRDEVWEAENGSFVRAVVMYRRRTDTPLRVAKAAVQNAALPMPTDKELLLMGKGKLEQAVRELMARKGCDVTTARSAFAQNRATIRSSYLG